MGQDSFEYGGARVLVELHERRLREFLDVWREAEDRQLELPPTSDPNYESREVLLAHVLGAAARYLVWICEQLEVVPPPEIDPNPEPDGLAARADQVLEQTLAAWRDPLKGLTEERAYAPVHESRWGPSYCIDAMLEHAVMHPIRHAHQLRQLIKG